MAASTCLALSAGITAAAPSGMLCTVIQAFLAACWTQKSVSEPFCVTPTVLPFRSAMVLIGEETGTRTYQPAGVGGTDIATIFSCTPLAIASAAAAGAMV